MRALLALAALLAAGGCVRSNRTVADELAASARERPRPDLDAVAAAGYAALPARTPLRAVVAGMAAGKLPVVAGRVNGRATPLLVDTGSTHVFLTGPAARAANLYMPQAAEVAVITPGTKAPHRIGVVESVGLRGFSFGPGLAAFPLVERRRAGTDRRSAVLGASVLCHFRVTFDFGERVVRFEPLPAPGRPGPLSIRTVVNGQPLDLLVDSGAERVVLEPRLAQRLGLVTPARARELAAKRAAGGRIERESVRLKRVRVAGREFRDVPGWVLPTFPERPGAPAGLLGLAAFGRLAWTLDYGTRRLTVEE